ncbi:MAG: hypothetical protein ACYC35_29620, partial [Pirellulales bacterium]
MNHQTQAQYDTINSARCDSPLRYATADSANLDFLRAVAVLCTTNGSLLVLLTVHFLLHRQDFRALRLARPMRPGILRGDFQEL